MAGYSLRLCCGLLVVVAVSWSGCGGAEPGDLSLSPKSIRPGPVVARVGEAELRLGEVEILAGMAVELRGELGLEVAQELSFQDKLDLAIELVALSVEAGKHDFEAGDERERLLARVYLTRLLQEPEERPVTPEELERAHQEEIQRYISTRESDFYRPTTVDVAAITIGYFPDFHPPQDDEEPLLAREQIEDLARRIHSESASLDLDGFLALGRKYMAGNPTVEIKEFPQVLLTDKAPRTDEIVFKALKSLPDNGAVTDPIWTERGVWLVRRGATYPGKGEQIDEVKPQIVSRILTGRRRSVFEERIVRLRERYRIETWPERLK